MEVHLNFIDRDLPKADSDIFYIWGTIHITEHSVLYFRAHLSKKCGLFKECSEDISLSCVDKRYQHRFLSSSCSFWSAIRLRRVVIQTHSELQKATDSQGCTNTNTHKHKHTQTHTHVIRLRAQEKGFCRALRSSRRFRSEPLCLAHYEAILHVSVQLTWLLRVAHRRPRDY